MDLSHRSDLSELMDDAALDEATYRLCLRDLSRVNKVTFTHRPMLRWLDAATRALPAGSRISVLDVAYGYGDLLRAIAGWAERRGFVAALSGIDLNPRSAQAARGATGRRQNIDFCTGDVFAYTPQAAPDFIVSSQFTHHLPDDDIIRLLRWMDATATRGWAIADLQRHAFAYYGYPLLARLLRWHEIVRHDGAVSIARGFTRGEWAALVRAAGVPARIAWRVPFRHLVSRVI